MKNQLDQKAAVSLTCGIVMPISPIDGCGADHWADVKAIILDAVQSIDEPKFSASLVSDADDIGVIQKRIIQGLYNSHVVVCDVSAKNSNVMFELGMRLAFDKPTVIIKDDKTDYSFDTGVIEHLTYPRDLRFARMVAFKKQLAEKVLATYQAAERDPNHSTFLKNFGTFTVAHLNQQEASSDQVILEMLTELQHQVSFLRHESNRSRVPPTKDDVAAIVQALMSMKRSDPSLDLDAPDKLVDILGSSFEHANVTAKYATRSEFTEAVVRACKVASTLTKHTRVASK